MSSRRSASVGALPRENKHNVSRNVSAGGLSLDVRCACQYFQCDSLLPERVKPVDSRPSSKLDFHDENMQTFEQPYQPEHKMARVEPLHPLNREPSGELLDSSINRKNFITMVPADSITPKYLPHTLSEHGRTPSLNKISTLEPYIEPDRRSGQLVIANIADPALPNKKPTFFASRQMSVGVISSLGRAQDVDTMSTCSARSLRRGRRSLSRSELFVASINIPNAKAKEERSVSASRRSSNADFTTSFEEMKSKTPVVTAVTLSNTMLNQESQLPQLNIIAPTPTPTVWAADTPPNFAQNDVPIRSGSVPRASSTSRAPSVPWQDYRKAKPPITSDYMRPDEDTTNQPQFKNNILPQNRPISVSTNQPEISSLRAVDPTVDMRTWNLSPNLQKIFPTSELINNEVPLEKTVSDLEEVMQTHNIVDINDSIRLRTIPPPYDDNVTEVSSLNLGEKTDIDIVNTIDDVMNVNEVSSLNLGEKTDIDIVNTINEVNIDLLLKEESEKANQLSTSHETSLMGVHFPPPPSSPSFLPALGSTETQDALKDRAQLTAPKSENSTTFTNLKRESENDPMTNSSAKQRKTIEFDETPIEIPTPSSSNKTIPPIKSSYTSRFKSIFSSGSSDQQKEKEPLKSESLTLFKQEKSPKLYNATDINIEKPLKSESTSFSFRRKDKSANSVNVSLENQESPFTCKSSSSIKREKSPARAIKRFLPKLSKVEPTSMKMVSGASAVLTKAPNAEPMAVKVTETFSLKVDEMDQYCSRPGKPSSSPPKIKSFQVQQQSNQDSSQDMRQSTDISEAFAPLVISAENCRQIVSGGRRLYSSQIDIKSQISETELFKPLKEEPSGKYNFSLYTSKDGLITAPINIGGIKDNAVHDFQSKFTRDLSEQRQTTSKNLQSLSPNRRTQSQERPRLKIGEESMSFGAPVTKTVSFSFKERPSRLSHYENSALFKKGEHEYEPIGVPPSDVQPSVASASEITEGKQSHEKVRPTAEIDTGMYEAKETSPELDTHDDELAKSELEETDDVERTPLKPENRFSGLMARAQDQTHKIQTGFKNQAGKLKSKLRSHPKPKTVEVATKGAQSEKDERRFKAPDLSKFKIKRPDMSKFKDIKRPEFTKFNKSVDMPKFKLPEKLTNIKLKRSKSLKENDANQEEEETLESTEPQPAKKIFEFNFGTYPRAFRKKKKLSEPQVSFGTETGTEEPSLIPSSETQPSMDSSSSPQGDRGPGPVRSNWAHKFADVKYPDIKSSDISYNESEGSRYRQYDSEQESFERESSAERPIKEDLERISNETPSVGILGGVTESKQFAEFDEENRAIHEISSQRAGEFKRRPLVHQDSDLRSEDSKDAVGWTDREIMKNKLLRKAELEAEASYLKYPSEEGIMQETLSTASSGKKVVMEEIDDDEFFLRKRGISEDNIELRQYISAAIREGYDMPLNALEHVGRANEPIEYAEDYDMPPPKPRRLHKTYHHDDSRMSQECSDYGDDLSLSQNGSDFFVPPKAPTRKQRSRSRSKYSMDSQDVPERPESIKQYFDDDEDYLRPPHTRETNEVQLNLNNFNTSKKTAPEDELSSAFPQPPMRRKRQQRDSSLDKNSYIDEFMGRSVSNSFLPHESPEEVVVYRTEHEYPVAMAQNDDSVAFAKSKLKAMYDEDDLLQPSGLSSHRKDEEDSQDKFIIDMMESDGYAVVRKENMPKPTPPARRKKFTRSPGERFTTTPYTSGRNAEPPERPPPPEAYIPTTEEIRPSTPTFPSSALFSDAPRNFIQDHAEKREEEETSDYDRAGSPRDLQSGEVINKMKFRPLPPPPRPPREKRQRPGSKEHSIQSEEIAYEESTSEDPDRIEEIEVSTQTDPLPDDFVCEDFEITEDMKVIEPRVQAKTLADLIKNEKDDAELEEIRRMTEDEQLAQCVQRFRDANQRSLSEKSRSSQADRSRSLSRPQTPSAVVIEKRVSTPVPSLHNETMLEASLTVHPIDDLELEEEALRREGLLTDSSQHSKSDLVSPSEGEAEEEKDYRRERLFLSDSSQHSRSEIITQSEAEEEQEEVSKAGTKSVESLRSQEYTPSESEIKTDVEGEGSQRETFAPEYRNEERRHASDRYDEDENENEKEQTELEILERKILNLQQRIMGEDLRPVERNQKDEPEAHSDHFAHHLPEEFPPQPPPRRKSATTIETLSPISEIEPTAITNETLPEQTLARDQTSQAPQNVGLVENMEVAALRVGALQAGQIMVNQVQGAQINAHDFECKSGNLVVQNIEFPAGFIEDIVQRVRGTERGPSITEETQTSLQTSIEALPTETVASRPEVEPNVVYTEINTIENLVSSSTAQPVFSAVAESHNADPPLRAVTPQEFYNIHRSELDRIADERHSSYHRHRHRRAHSYTSSEEAEEYDEEEMQRLRHRSRSRTHPRETPTVAQAGCQFISACSLSLVRIISQLTDFVRGTGDKQHEHRIPTLVVLFIAITFALLIYLLSGRNVHTHHWDFFNPPGNAGRQS